LTVNVELVRIDLRCCY